MGASENFCLRWNDFESNVSGAFRELRAESDFFDISLACDGAHGRTLQAHKVILSACSTFFKQMLRSQSVQSGPNPPSSPLIYLRGVKLQDLESVLDFMYHGEVNVAQEDLNSFLAVAEDLQIKGLTQTATGKRSHAGGKRSAAAPSGSSSAGPSSASSKRLRTSDDDEVSVKHEPSLVETSAAATAAAAAGGSANFDSTSGNYGGDDGVDETFDESYTGYADGEETGEMLDTSSMGGAAVSGNVAAPAGGGMEQQDSTKGRKSCLLYTSPSPRDRQKSRMPSSA